MLIVIPKIITKKISQIYIAKETTRELKEYIRKYLFNLKGSGSASTEEKNIQDI